MVPGHFLAGCLEKQLILKDAQTADIEAQDEMDDSTLPRNIDKWEYQAVDLYDLDAHTHAHENENE